MAQWLWLIWRTGMENRILSSAPWKQDWFIISKQTWLSLQLAQHEHWYYCCQFIRICKWPATMYLIISCASTELILQSQSASPCTFLPNRKWCSTHHHHHIFWPGTGCINSFHNILLSIVYSGPGHCYVPDAARFCHILPFQSLPIWMAAISSELQCIYLHAFSLNALFHF